MAVPFSQANKPLLLVLYLSGLYCLPDRSDKRYIRVMKRVLDIFLAVICCGSLFVNASRQIYFTLSRSEFMMLYLISYILGEAYIAVVFRFGCQKTFSAFFVEFEAYQQKHCQNDVSYRSVLILGIIAALNYVMNWFTGVYYVFFGGFSQQCALVFLYKPTAVTIQVSAIICHPAAVLPTLFFLTHTYAVLFFTYLSVWRLLKLEANTVSKILSQLDRHAVNDKPEVIEAIRLRHADLCHVTACANQFVGHILAAFYGAGLCCVLLVIHGLLRGGMDITELVAMAQISALFALFMIIMTLAGASLNLKMHEPADFLFRLDVLRMTGRGDDVVSRFLLRVQGEPIGFNVYNLFTVDTSFILTMCGTLLTYALVIAQFPESDVTPRGPGVSTNTPLTVTLADHTDQLAFLNSTADF